MLAYILAIALGTGSIGLFASAFIAPKIHRQDDFLWSGLGLFYALVLWVCAARFTGGILLGQTAAVLLLLSFGWQTLKLRGAISNPEKIAEAKEFSVTKSLLGVFQSKPKAIVPPTPPATETATETTVETPADTAKKDTETTENTTATSPTDRIDTKKTETETATTSSESTKETASKATSKATPTQKKAGFSLGGLFNKQKTKAKTDLKAALDAEEAENEDFDDLVEDKAPEAAKSTETENQTTENVAKETETDRSQDAPDSEKNSKIEPEKEIGAKTEPEVIVGEVVDSVSARIDTEMTAVLETTTEKNEAVTTKIEEKIEDKIEGKQDEEIG